MLAKERPRAGLRSSASGLGLCQLSRLDAQVRYRSRFRELPDVNGRLKCIHAHFKSIYEPYFIIYSSVSLIATAKIRL